MELLQTHFWLRSQDYGRQTLLHFEVRLHSLAMQDLQRNCAGTGYESVDVARNLEIRRFFQKEDLSVVPQPPLSPHWKVLREGVLQGEIDVCSAKQTRSVSHLRNVEGNGLTQAESGSRIGAMV